MKQFFLTGTYTEQVTATGKRSEGIYLCSLENGRMEQLECIPMRNPSFLTVDEKRRHIYAVNELQSFQGVYGGGLTDVAYDEAGHFTIVGAYSTGGTDPCHVAVSPDGEFVCAANYSDGRVTAFRLDPDGRVNGERRIFELDGKGPNPQRQEGPHAHCVLFGKDGEMAVNDLGTDQIRAFRIEDGSISRAGEEDIRLTPGSGPRTGTWSRDGMHLYVTNELNSTVTHLVWENGKLKPEASVSTLPEGETCENYCSDLHLSSDGKTLYAANRGHDSIAIFRVAADGSLRIRGWTPSGGSWPRCFAIDPEGKWLVAACQNGGRVTAFAIGENGELEQRGVLEMPFPVCVQFVGNS